MLNYIKLSNYSKLPQSFQSFKIIWKLSNIYKIFTEANILDKGTFLSRDQVLPLWETFVKRKRLLLKYPWICSGNSKTFCVSLFFYWINAKINLNSLYLGPKFKQVGNLGRNWYNCFPDFQKGRIHSPTSVGRTVKYICLCFILGY